ncbi:MAG TPA: carboxymuconolactone decarboxylase family protein [Stellaceae bacterium]
MAQAKAPAPTKAKKMKRPTNKQFVEGLKVRKAVLGPDYVENALSAATPFSWPMQEFVTEYCWGTVWCRPGLNRKTRSIINLAMLTALNRPHEIEVHVKGALRNGLTPEEIGEIFLQAAVYCGVPAAVDSFRIAKKVLDEAGQ